MGIKGLENFIRNRSGNKKIAEQISIRNEIAAWRHRNNGKNPTIVIDLKELNRVIEKIDEGGLVLGGRFSKINEIMEYFFDEIKKCNANLVFFARLDEGKFKDIDIFASPFSAYVCIKQRRCLRTYLEYKKQKHSNLFPSERIWYNLQQICAKYGQFYVNYGLSKRAILAYAREKRDDVMAVMTRNTDFFVHNCNFEYWSLSDVDFSTLKIAKFCRFKLEHTLDFSPHQMQLLLVLSQLKPADQFKLYRTRGSGNRFIDLLSYVEKQRHGPDGYDLSMFNGKLTKDQIEEMEKQISDLNALNKFKGSFNEDINSEFITELMDNDIIFDMVLLFCKQNIPFAYKLINETMSVPKDLLFIDLHQSGSVQYIDLVIDVTLKMIGIVFKDISSEQRPKTRAVKINRNPNASSSSQMEMDINYPTMTLPSLVDLIAKEDDHSVAESRWNLMMWLLNVDKNSLSKIRTSADSKYIRVVNLTLQFLSSNSIMPIDSIESEAIRRTEKECQHNIYTQKSVRSPPEIPDERFPKNIDVLWIQAAHKYTIAFELVCHCFELCGLRKETVLIQFDALKFHDAMREHVKDNFEDLPLSMKNLHF